MVLMLYWIIMVGFFFYSFVSIGFNLYTFVDVDNKQKTRSLPPGINAKLVEQQQTESKLSTASKTKSKTHNITPKSSKTSKDEFHSVQSNSSSSSIFGSITAKAISIFESKDHSKQAAEKHKSSKVLLETATKKSSTHIEESEVLEHTSSNVWQELASKSSEEELLESDSGFLNKLMHNSKRNLSKFQEDDEQDMQENSAKKLHISSSMFDTKVGSNETPKVGASKSALNFAENVQEMRKEIKREIMYEGKTGLSAMLNNFVESEKTVTSRPKSGAAARQRYEPLEIVNTSAGSISISDSNEAFQSTSIVRKITEAQAAQNNQSKSLLDHHFEKKPKIVGLSNFQQKISRSNDAVARAAAHSSHESLQEFADSLHVEQENLSKRKAVEKSRSFRSYIKDEPRSADLDKSSNYRSGNMPSLPDLSLNLRVPYFSEFILKEKDYSSPSPPPLNKKEDADKSVSLGFEINDNTLLNHAAKGALKNSSPKLLTSSSIVMPSQNISEIEQNIDMLVKSPFISVLRKNDSKETLIQTTNYDQGALKSDLVRPKNLELATFAENKKSKQNSPDKDIKHVQLRSSASKTSLISTSPIKSPSKPKVELRNSQSDFPSESSTDKSPIASPTRSRETLFKNQAVQVSTLSSPPLRPQKLQFQTRNYSQEKLNENHSPQKQTSPISSAVNLRDKSKLNSNAVSQVNSETERKSAPVLIGNSPKSMPLNGNENARRSSVNNSNEQLRTCKVPEFLKVHLNKVDSNVGSKSNVVLSKNFKENKSSINISERSASTDDLSLRRYSNESVEINEREESITPDFEVLNSQTRAISSNSLRCSSTYALGKSPQKTQANLVSSISLSEASEKTEETHRLSLQERKQLFLKENRHKEEKKLQELRNERKKSISEELQREKEKEKEEKEKIGKSFVSNKNDNKMEHSSTLEQAAVVLRKKPPIPLNAQQTLSNNSSNNNNNNTTKTKDDTTPELMKVFMRRSLKVKDEDLETLSEKIGLVSKNNASPLNGCQISTNVLKKLTPNGSNANVDSDKENQSASEEKLDKLNSEIAVINCKTKETELSNHFNRNSVADFRNGAYKHNQTVKSSSNNNLANASSPKSHIPIAGNIKNGALKCSFVHDSSLNNNGNSAKDVNNGRTSANLDMAEQSSPIARSATVGEFKGIHQRRAEWEQRVKNANK